MFSISASRTKLWAGILTGLGIVFLLGGGIMYHIFPKILEKKIKQNLILREGTPTYEKWVESPVPIYLRIYFFNVTNPEEVLKRHKPKLQEIGPFVFKEMRKKDVIGWDEENGTVHYINEKFYYFVPEESYSDLDLKITTLNVPFLTLSRKIMGGNFVAKLAGPPWLNPYKLQLYITHSVGEFLFEGIPMDVLRDISSLVKIIGIPIEIKPRFGFLYQKNGTREEYYSVYTGATGIDKYTYIATFQNMSSLPYWHNPYCNMINGTDAKQFPFPLDKTKNLYSFSAELCRSLYVEYDHDVEVNGIPAYRYIATAKLFARGPENDGFCTDPNKCPPSGVHQVSRCKKGVPIVISAPHFFLADPVYINAVEGLSPNKEFHETRIDVEPQTGVTLRALRRIMFSAEVESYKMITGLMNAPKLVHPILWTEQSAVIPPDLAEKFKAKVIRPAKIANAIFITAMVLGVVGLLLAALLLVNYFYVQKAKPSDDSKKETSAPSYKLVATQPPPFEEKIVST